MNRFNFFIFNQKLQCNRLHNRISHLTKRQFKTFRTVPKKYRKEHPVAPLALDYIENSWLSWAKSKGKTTEEVIPQIVSKLEAKSGFFEQVEEIVADLKCIYPSADVVVFGSAASNLALARSDVDLFMHFKDGGNKSLGTIVSYVKKDLLRSRMFRSAEAIYATVPIVKCVHKNEISCDISFSSGISIYDSQLIKFLVSTDERVRQLMLILKYLIKRESILYTNHALIVMIIFFLQRIDSPLIPPIHYLQSRAETRKMFNGWDVSFSNDITDWQGVSSLSVIELLHKFFQFYSSFEFGLNVISVFTANSYLKPVFADGKSLPAEFDLYKRRLSDNEELRFYCNKFMCIQGFFNHSVNISRNVMSHSVNGFQKYCRTFALIGDELLHENSSEEDKLEFLIKLFEGDARTGQPSNKIKTGYMGTAHTEVLFTMDSVCLDDINLSADELRSKWWNNEFDKIVEIIRDVWKSEVSIKSGRSESKSDNVVEEKIISCEMVYRELLFKLRGEAGKELNLPESMPVLEREKKITQHLVGKIKKSETPYKFDIVCVFEKKPTCIRLKLEPKDTAKGSDDFLLHISAVFKKRLPKWLASTREKDTEF